MGNVVATGGSTSTGGTPPPALPVYTPNVFHSAVTTGFLSGQQASDPSSSSPLSQTIATGGSACANGGPSSSAGGGGGAPSADEVTAFMSDFPSVNFLRCIGSSRLFRTVAVVTPEEGLCVGKLLVRKETQRTVASYVQQYALQLQAYKAHLLPDLHPNVCTYGRLLSSDRTALLLRQFFPFCLSDRLHARPFLSNSQQLFLAFQVVLGVTQFHSLGLVHGDIKAENVGVTSWLHGCLIDAAPWKPLRLSLSDGRELTAFFTSPFSGKCQIAPERFCCEPEDLSFPKDEDRGFSNVADSSAALHSLPPGAKESADILDSSFDLSSVEALQSADVFSMACTLAEIFASDAPGRQQTVIDLPVLLQLRRLLRNRSRRHSVLTRRKGGARKADAAATVGDASVPSSVVSGSSDRLQSTGRPRPECHRESRGGSPISAPRRGLSHDEEKESGRLTAEEREQTAGYSSPFGPTELPPPESSSVCSDTQGSPKEFARGQEAGAGDGYAVSSRWSSHVRGGNALPSSPVPSPGAPACATDDVGVPKLRALSYALSAIRSRRIREALQNHVLLRYPEMRLTASECLERWAGSRSEDEAFFPPCFLSYFLPLFTVLTHPAYQQPDLRILLIRHWLPHILAAILQTRRKRRAGEDESHEAHASGGERTTSTSATPSAEGEVRCGVVVGAEGSREERQVVQVLEEAVEHHVCSVDPQVAYQSILHGALTSPDCAPVAALISAWSAARRQEAARGVEAALQDEKSERRRSSDVSATRLSSSSAAGLPPQSQLVPDSARRVSGSSPRCPPVDSHADGSARNKPAPLSTVSGVSEHSLEDPSGASLEEAAAAGAAEAVGGFGVVPHPDLSLPSARRFSSRLLAVWKRSRLRTVTEKRPAAEVLRALETERCAVYNELFLSPFRPPSSPVDSIDNIAGARSTSDLTGNHTSPAHMASDGFPKVHKEVISGVALGAGEPSSSAVAGEVFPASTRFRRGPLSEASPGSSSSGFCNRSENVSGSLSPSGLSYPSPACLSASLSRPCYPVITGLPSLPRRGSCVLVAELIGSTLQQCSSPQVRSCGVSMLAFLSRFSTLHTLLKCIFPYLVKALDDPTPDVRVTALRVFPVALCQVYGTRSPLDSTPTDRWNSAESPTVKACRENVLSGPRPGQDVNNSESTQTRQLQAKKMGSSSADCLQPGRSCLGEPDDEEEAADALDDLAAIRSLACGVVDFSLFFIQILLPRLHRLASTDGEPSVQLTVAEQLPMFLLSVQHCAEVQAAVQAMAASSTCLPSTPSAVHPGFAPDPCTTHHKVSGRGSHFRSPTTPVPPSPLLLFSDSRLQQLRSAVKPLLQHLLTSRQPAERLALLQRVDALAEFMGPEVSQQFLLPYLIMQLNDPLVPSIRAAVTLALGRMSLLLGGARGIVETCVLPCCEQALVDIREEVLLAALQTLQLLASAGLLMPCWSGGSTHHVTGGAGSGGKLGGAEICSGEVLNLLRSRVLPLLVHPCEAVRHEALRMLRVLQTRWGQVDTFVFLVPLFKPFVAASQKVLDRGNESLESFCGEHTSGRRDKRARTDGHRLGTGHPTDLQKKGTSMGTGACTRVREGSTSTEDDPDEEEEDQSTPLLFGVDELCRFLRPPLSHAVYVHLMKPEYGQTLGALNAAIRAAEEGRADEDALAKLLFKSRTLATAGRASSKKERSSLQNNHSEEEELPLRDRAFRAPSLRDKEKKAGQRVAEISRSFYSSSAFCKAAPRTKAEGQQKDSSREPTCSSASTSETDIDEDDEERGAIDIMEDNLEKFMASKRLGHVVHWGREQDGRSPPQVQSAYSSRKVQSATPVCSRRRASSWLQHAHAFFTFFSSDDPLSVSLLSWEQRRCIGILLGLRPSDRRALVLLLPYLSRVAMDRSQNALLSTLALFTPPLLAPAASSDSQSKHASSASSLQAAVAAAVDQLDDALPAGELLGSGCGDEEALRRDLQEEEEDPAGPPSRKSKGEGRLECSCLQPPRAETAVREYLLRCCLLSPPLPAAIHSLPSLRLSPLQALLPLLPASLLSSSSCEVPSVLTVCMLLTLSSQQESRGHSAFLRRYWNRKVVVPTNSDADKAEIPAAPGESKDANQLGRQSVMANALFSSTNTLQGLGLFGEHSNFSDRSQRADGRQALSDCLSDPGVVWREWKGNDQALPPETRRDFLTQLEVAASAATGATELLAVAAAAAAGSRMPLPSLQQAMLGGPQVGSDLAVLLNREAFRLSGLLPFELVPAAVRGAVAGAIVSKWTSVTSSRESPPQSILAAGYTSSRKRSPLSCFVSQPASTSSSRSFCLPVPLQRDWRCVVLGLPRRPSLEVGRLSKWLSLEGSSSTLNLYSYVTASPPVVLQHPLLLHPALALSHESHPFGCPTRLAGGLPPPRWRSRTDSASTLGTFSPRDSPPNNSEDRRNPRASLRSSRSLPRDSANLVSDDSMPGLRAEGASVCAGVLASSSVVQSQRETPTGGPSASGEPRTSSSHSGDPSSCASGSVGSASRPSSDACSTQPGSSRTGGVPYEGSARHAPSASQADTAPGGERTTIGSSSRKEHEAGRAGRAGGGGGSLQAAGGGGPAQKKKLGGPTGAAWAGCGVVLCAVPGMADMAYWRPRGELVGTLWEADITGGGGDEFSTVERGIMARSGRRIQLASSEDGRLLITGCMQTVGGPIHAWSCTEVVRHGRASPFSSWSLPKPLAATALRFLHNTRTVSVGASDGTCRLFRLDEGRRAGSGGSSARARGGRMSFSSTSRGGDDSCDLLVTLPPPSFPLISPSNTLPSNNLSVGGVWGHSRYDLGRNHTLLEQRLVLRSLLPSCLSDVSSVFSSVGSSFVPSDPSSLFVKHIAKATGAMTTASRAVVSLDHFDSCFEQLILYLLQNGQAGAFDLRASSTPIFSSALLPPWWGAPTAQSVSPDGKCLCLGTAGGFLLLFDLRLLLPVRIWRVRQENSTHRGRLWRHEEEKQSDGKTRDVVAPVILQLRPCPLRLLLHSRPHFVSSSFLFGSSSPNTPSPAYTRSDSEKYVAPEVPDPAPPTAAESSTTTGTLSGHPGGGGGVFSSVSTSSEKGFETGGKGGKTRGDREETLGSHSFDNTQRSPVFIGADTGSSSSSSISTEGSLVIALIGGEAGLVAILDLEFGQVLATFSSSCYSAGLVSPMERDVPTTGQREGSNDTRQADKEDFSQGSRIEATDPSSRDYAARLWLEPVERAALFSASSPSFVPSADQVIAGLSVTAHSPHAPRCLFVPPFLRAPPTFFLVGGNDRCVRFWGLKNSAVFLQRGEDDSGDDEAGQRARREVEGCGLGGEDATSTRRYFRSRAGQSSIQTVDAYVVLAPENACCAGGHPWRPDVGCDSWSGVSPEEGAGCIGYADRFLQLAQSQNCVHYQVIEEEVVSGAGDLLSRTAHFQEVCRVHRHQFAAQRFSRRTRAKNQQQGKDRDVSYGGGQTRSTREGDLKRESELEREARESREALSESGEDDLSDLRDGPAAARAQRQTLLSAGGKDACSSRSLGGRAVSAPDSLSDGEDYHKGKRPGFSCPTFAAEHYPCCCNTREEGLRRAHERSRFEGTDSCELSFFRRKSEGHWCLDGGRGEEEERLLRDAGPRPPSVQHRDAILDLSFLELNNQLLLVSSGRDGIVRVWR